MATFPLILHLNFIVIFSKFVQSEGRTRVSMPFKPCLSVLRVAARLGMVLEGRRTASGASRTRKVRTPKGAMPRNPGPSGRDTRGRTPAVCRGSTDSATENQTAGVSQATPARVKRCGKSAPREAQATRHGKPHRVQGQIGNPGAARSRFRESGTDSGYRLPRQMILSPRKRADRIRLTALPKPIPIPNSEGRVIRAPFPPTNSQGLA